MSIEIASLVISIVTLVSLFLSPIIIYFWHKFKFCSTSKKIFEDIFFSLDIKDINENFLATKSLYENNDENTELEKIIGTYLNERFFLLNNLISTYENYLNINSFSKSKYYIKLEPLIMKQISSELKKVFFSLLKNNFDKKSSEEFSNVVELYEKLRDEKYESIKKFFKKI